MVIEIRVEAGPGYGVAESLFVERRGAGPNDHPVHATFPNVLLN
jgi:hypothetical protein